MFYFIIFKKNEQIQKEENVQQIIPEKIKKRKVKGKENNKLNVPFWNL